MLIICIIKGKDNNLTPIIAGGLTDVWMSSTEIYSRALNKWEQGPRLPQGINAAQVLWFTYSN